MTKRGRQEESPLITTAVNHTYNVFKHFLCACTLIGSHSARKIRIKQKDDKKGLEKTPVRDVKRSEEFRDGGAVSWGPGRAQNCPEISF